MLETILPRRRPPRRAVQVPVHVDPTTRTLSSGSIIRTWPRTATGGPTVRSPRQTNSSVSAVVRCRASSSAARIAAAE